MRVLLPIWPLSILISKRRLKNKRESPARVIQRNRNVYLDLDLDLNAIIHLVSTTDLLPHRRPQCFRFCSQPNRIVTASTMAYASRVNILSRRMLRMLRNGLVSDFGRFDTIHRRNSSTRTGSVRYLELARLPVGRQPRQRIPPHFHRAQRSRVSTGPLGPDRLLSRSGRFQVYGPSSALHAKSQSSAIRRP